MKAIVRDIQVGGGQICGSLEEACREYMGMIEEHSMARTKINFAIELPNNKIKHITIRDVDGETIAYGDFEGLPSMLDWARELQEKGGMI